MANDPEVISRRAELQARLNAHSIEQSEMTRELNRMATRLLQDEQKREFYAELANRQADAGPSRSAGETTHCGPELCHEGPPVFVFYQYVDMRLRGHKALISLCRPPYPNEVDHIFIQDDDSTVQFAEEPALHDLSDKEDVSSHVADPRSSQASKAVLIPSHPVTSEDVPPCLDQTSLTLSFELGYPSPFSADSPQRTPSLSDDLLHSPRNQSEHAYRTHPVIGSPLHSPPSTEELSISNCIATDSFTGAWSLRRTLLVLALGYKSERDVRSVALSCHGDFIVCGFRNGILQTLSVRTGMTICEMSPGHSGCVSSIAVSPNDENIASGSNDGTMRVWNAVSGALLFESSEGHIDAVDIVAFSPCGQKVVSCSSTSIAGMKIWHLPSGSLLATIDSLDWLISDRLEHVAFTLDGQYLVGVFSTAEVHHWEAETGIWKGDSSGECSTVWSAQSGSRHTISSYENGSILGWNILDFAARSSSPRLAISQNRKYVAEWSLRDDNIHLYERDSTTEQDEFLAGGSVVSLIYDMIVLWH